jgi:hypothetical protein
MRLFWLCSAAILLYLIITPFGNATEEYAKKTGKSCAYCHLDPFLRNTFWNSTFD